MTTKRQKSKSDAVSYIPRVLKALRELGGVAKASAVKEAIVSSMAEKDEKIDDSMLESGAIRYANDIQWARMHLVNAGLLEPYNRDSHGVWKLTPAGWTTQLDAKTASGIHSKSTSKSTHPKADIQTAPGDEDNQPELPEMASWRSEVKKLLITMPPPGFERLCAEIMARNGLHATKVTGQSGDKGIDGEGLLAFDSLELLSIRVAWQCKRFNDRTVGSDEVRNFRGSLDMATNHGIIFTTSTFTAAAIQEARQPEKKPIKLVDLYDLISKLEKLKLGFKDDDQSTLDREFFKQFCNAPYV